MITGSGGRLGRLLHAAAGLSDCGGVEILFQSRGHDADLRWSPGDPFDRLPKCDMVVALWGRTDGDERALAQNSELADLSRKVARHCGAERVVHMSSAAVYGPGQDLTEEAPMTPVNPYGAAKCAMETRVSDTAQEGDPEDVILRPETW
ncbi:MAG: NAD-dependent epimerase/dehydratase family protein [Pseudomonadota bacterium]